MKNVLALSIAFLAMVPLARGAVIYSGVQNLGVPQDPDGLYLNIYSGATAGAQPGSWNTAPWLNPFFGGVWIAMGELFRPVITGTEIDGEVQIVNLAAGTMIDGSSTFASAESGSTTHVGGGPLQFQLATPGYMGFAFRQTVAGPVYYGWLQLTINNASAGTIKDWAYESVAGVGIAAGVPEPGRALLLFFGAFLTFLRRKRRISPAV
jgi:hypothetical protein